MLTLTQFDYDNLPRLIKRPGVAVFMFGYDDWPVVLVVQDVAEVDPNAMLVDEER